MKTIRLHIDPTTPETAQVEFYNGPELFATMTYSLVSKFDYVDMCEDMANWTVGRVDEIRFL
jgi:hypothetical protein